MDVKKPLRKLLKKWPPLYELSSRLCGFLSLTYWKELWIGTKAQEQWWANRHLHKGNDWGYSRHSGEFDEWIMSYWESVSHSHRSLLIEKIAAFSPLSSVLEIGSNCGPNLYLLAQKFPDINIRGVDINPVAVQKGNNLLLAQGITNVSLDIASATDLKQFSNKSIDVVFTDAVLMYIGKDKIQDVIADMSRIARKGIILFEMHYFDSSSKDYDLGFRYRGHWLRDYNMLLKRYVNESQIKITKINEHIWPDPEWQRTGAIIEVKL